MTDTDTDRAPAPVVEAEPVETSQGVAVFDPDAPIMTRSIVVRSLAIEEGMRRLEHRRRLANMATHGTSEGEEQKREREVREADVVDAARRSQAEIRRHVDSYLKEHLEVIVGEVAALVVARTTERVEAGIAALHEQNAIQLDRIAADVRLQCERFLRGLSGSGT